MTTISNVGVGDLVDGKYRLLRIIGEGGWGIVFEGENARTLKRVAIKILRARADLTADIRTRFEREAQAAGRIGSEHIVEVFDLGTLADGSHYMVMELLVGEDLATRLRTTGRLDPANACKVVMQVLEGLSAAHEAGIMHRDLKPENLYLVPTRSGEEFVKILDFGISKFTTPGITSATMTGAILGSPCYMAPEQARGIKNVDPRTDLYSVGALLFECVTGRVPFDGDNFNDLMFKIALSPRPNPIDVRPDLDPALAAVLVKAIQADPNERFQTAEQFRDTLGAWLETQGVLSLRTPELRRVSRTTPRVGGNLSSTPTPSRMQNMHKPGWVEATAAVESGASSTPLSAASTLDRPVPAPVRKPSKAPAFAAMAVFALLAALGGAMLLRQMHHTTVADTAPSAATTAEDAPAHPLPAAVVTLPHLDPTTEPSAASADVEPAASASHGPALAVVPGRGTPPHAAPPPAPHGPVPVAKPAPSAEPPKTAEVAAAPPPPTPPPAPKPPVDSIEGRSIQTGL